MFSCSTGATVGGFGTIQSRRRLRYRPGTGIVGRFTALYPVSGSSSYLLAGFGHAEDGYYIGYNGTRFGLLHSSYGVRQIARYTVTTPSTTNETASIALGGVSYPIALTNNGNKAKTAHEISTNIFGAWSAMQLSESVVFLANSAALYSTTSFSSSATTLSGVFTYDRLGSASFDSWIYQENWSGDKLDGTR